ncbi:hypothetical protein D3C80_2049580 [compost metagenome]
MLGGGGQRVHVAADNRHFPVLLDIGKDRSCSGCARILPVFCRSDTKVAVILMPQQIAAQQGFGSFYAL